MTPTAISTAAPIHVGIIMDGNGRWAQARGLPRSAGHEHGAKAVHRTVEAACRFGVGTLTLYAFSMDNWQRPGTEVSVLMQLFERYLDEQGDRCSAERIRLSLIGRRDRLTPALRARAEDVEQATSRGDRMHLRLAIDYSARDAIWAAAEAMLRHGRASREQFSAAVRSGRGEADDAPDVDLVIRTGGERRLSDFLLWESAYAELWFTDRAWPDFTGDDLQRALDDFSRRERRFGALTQEHTVKT